MSCRTYAVIDKGIVVKIDELNLEAFKELFKNIECETNQDVLRQDVIDALCEDCQTMLGNDWEDGVICYKETYGNDINGDFVSLLDCGQCFEDVGVQKDDWVFMCLPIFPSLFFAAYESEEALIKQMKELYSKFIKDENFDYRTRLVTLQGYVWG